MNFGESDGVVDPIFSEKLSELDAYVELDPVPFTDGFAAYPNVDSATVSQVILRESNYFNTRLPHFLLIFSCTSFLTYRFLSLFDCVQAIHSEAE